MVFSRVSLTHIRDGCLNIRGKTEETSVLVSFRESFVANCYVVHPLRYNTTLLGGTPVLDLNIWSVCMMRPTFYNPPRSNATVAILPHHLFGSSNTHPLSSAPSSPHHHDHSEPDEFGWATLDDGRFYHTLTGIIAERHPFEES
ncbi:hypothetical protein RO3G_02402 [Rhizopus delemar RA 99-880]|uniref:Uncharacterized protein n=1 Tax=Rhizopus delemar (strain RA 99-880 / ATCC MYA-4621 / FGSC 9543 / NRRL 43880) TaxID=246409 RepID=I1BNB8_RHIO9|nr:hypothetical protein RO3G_02402 [Rhizopus delemar RA 99-880]|eukprot:EIE77698.1 hypothetical protein RO3G_02402 [Rhizopus delemar RA 99-880]